VTVAEIGAKLEAFYGRAPDRSTLGVIVREVGLTIVGDTILRPASVPPDAPISRVTTALPGIPTELREMFEELAQQPLSDTSELGRLVEEHVAEIENEHHVNEFVDLEGARALARDCRMLLERWESLLMPDRQFAHAAIRYFVSWQDAEHDLEIGGLDDDKKIMNAVLVHLGLESQSDGALAS
jgi:hypothetical protein